MGSVDGRRILPHPTSAVIKWRGTVEAKQSGCRRTLVSVAQRWWREAGDVQDCYCTSAKCAMVQRQSDSGGQPQEKKGYLNWSADGWRVGEICSPSVGGICSSPSPLGDLVVPNQCRPDFRRDRDLVAGLDRSLQELLGGVSC
jgi:hypothetical protein